MVFVLFYTWSGLPGYLAYAAAVQETSPTQMAQTEDKLKKLFQALEGAARDIPRETFDTKAVIEHVGRDPIKLFHWVRDETVLVPYRGALRGPQGVLMDRLGNSLDRALLLCEFLRLAGHQVRLARAALSEEQASQVLRNARAMPQGGVPTAPTRPRQAPDELVKRMELYAQQYQLDQAELRNIIDKLTLDQQRMAEQVAQRVAEQVPAIAAAVGQPAVDDSAIAQTAALDTLRDHWWVQWQQGSTWVDLDPTFADAESGRALAEVNETTQPDQLPDSLRHTVGIRLVVEFWEHGQLREVPVLTQDLVPAQLFGERMVVRHVPLNWPQDLNLLQEQDLLPRLKTTVLAQREWLPVLSVGAKNHFKHAFTDAGTINENPGANPIEPLGKTVGGLFRGRGEALKGLPTEPRSDTPQKKSEQAAQLTAEWIEYEIRTPGQPVRTIRRQLFDVLGPAARSTGRPPAPKITETQQLERGLTLLGESEILLLACQPSPEFVDYSTAEGLLTNREVLLDVMRNAASMAPNALRDKRAKLKPLPSQLYGLALARQEWSRFRGDVYLDRANILSYHKHLRLNPQGQLRMTEGVDIVANDVAVRSGSRENPFLMRLEQGVLDTNAEGFVLADASIQENTAALFAQSEQQGIEWVMIRTATQSAWQSMELPHDVRVRIERDLAEGYVVLVPKKAMLLQGQPVVGWWRVDPRNGQTLGIGEHGWGNATEHIVLQQLVMTVRLGFALFSMANCGIKAGEYKNATLFGMCATLGPGEIIYIAWGGIHSLGHSLLGLGIQVLLELIIHEFVHMITQVAPYRLSRD
jgi:hypothetical protein